MAESQLTLFCYKGSYFSSMVVMALNELGLSYTEHTVKTSDDDYSNVPVLMDGYRRILGPKEIIHYIDTKYSGDAHPTLFPKQYKRKIDDLCEKIYNLPVLLLTMGVDFFPQFADNPKAPFKQAGFSNIGGQQKNKMTGEKEVDAFLGLLQQVEEVLDIAENQLAANKGCQYLFSRQVTAADVYLSMLMFRLFNLGYENRFWCKGNRPQLEAYLQRFRDNKGFLRGGMISTPELTAAVPIIDFFNSTKDIAMPILIMIVSLAVYYFLRLFHLGCAKIFWKKPKRRRVRRYFKDLQINDSFFKGCLLNIPQLECLI